MAQRCVKPAPAHATDDGPGEEFVAASASRRHGELSLVSLYFGDLSERRYPSWVRERHRITWHGKHTVIWKSRRRRRKKTSRWRSALPVHAARGRPRERYRASATVPPCHKRRKETPPEELSTRSVVAAAAKDQLPPSRPLPPCTTREPNNMTTFAEGGRPNSATLSGGCLPAVVCRRCNLDLCAGARTLCRDRVGFELLLRDNLVDVLWASKRASQPSMKPGAG